MLFSSHFFLYTITLLCLPSIALATESQLKLINKSSLYGIRLKGEIEARRDKGELHRKHADLGVRVNMPLEGLTLGVNYRRIYQLSGNDWLTEDRPYIQLEQRFISSNKLDWRFRLRQDFRHREGKGRSKRSRFRAKVKLPYQLFNAKPYLSNEYYYDLTSHQLTQTRIDLGLTFQLLKATVPTLSIKITAKQKAKWQTTSAIVLSIAF